MLAKSEVAREILLYLEEHPDAQDTLEGIVEWWLLERKIKHQTAMVKEALAELVGSGLIIEHRPKKSKSQYRINRQRYGEILAHLREGSGR